MALQAYPDLMEPWGLTVVPVTGPPFGTALLLHGVGADPITARELGFEPTPFGYVLTPGGTDPDFGAMLADLCASVPKIVPTARLASLDPVPFAIPAAATTRATEVGRRHRFRLRAALAASPEAPLPLPLPLPTPLEPLAVELVEVARTVMDRPSETGGRMAAVPHAIGIGGDKLAYAVREEDGIRFGVVSHGSRSFEVPGVIIRTAPEGHGEPMFVIAGRGSNEVPCCVGLAEHLLRTALMRMRFELVDLAQGARAFGVRRGVDCGYGSLHDEAFPSWEDGADAPAGSVGPPTAWVS